MQRFCVTEYCPIERQKGRSNQRVLCVILVLLPLEQCGARVGKTRTRESDRRETKPVSRASVYVSVRFPV